MVLLHSDRAVRARAALLVIRRLRGRDTMGKPNATAPYSSPTQHGSRVRMVRGTPAGGYGLLAWLGSPFCTRTRPPCRRCLCILSARVARSFMIGPRSRMRQDGGGAPRSSAVDGTARRIAVVDKVQGAAPHAPCHSAFGSSAMPVCADGALPPCRAMTVSLN